MSKIAKALERARLEQPLAATTPVRDLSSVSYTVVENEDKVISVDYTSTKVCSTQDALLEKNRILTHIHNSVVQDHYSLLRTQLLQKTKGKGLNTIMITSVGQDEGKTVTALNLAISMAREVGQTSLLVDLDLRSPDVGNYLGFDDRAGIADYLVGDIDIQELFVNPGVQKIVVLPAGRAISVTTELLGSPKMKRLVLELKHRYADRYVFFDCPSLINNPDSMVFSSYVDGIILVVEADKTPKALIKKAVSMLSQDKLLGIVFNKAMQE